MKAKQSLLMFLIVVLGTTSTLGQPIISPSCFSDSHDITSLQAWGPYSKRYAGISHIPNMQAGMRFDFSVMPITAIVNWFLMCFSNHLITHGISIHP